MTRQRILVITRNLPPLVGGMERLNWHMVNELSKHSDVHVIGPLGSSSLKPQNVTLSECPLKPLSLFLLVAFLKGAWSAWRSKPDTILAGSGLTAPLAWLISKTCHADSAAYLHGFDITVNHYVYRKIWQPTFKKLGHVIVNSSPTRALAINAGVSASKLSIVHPGVELPHAPQPDNQIALFKAKNGISEKRILLSVGRLTTRKGLREFVQYSLPDIVKAIPNSILVVIGDAPKNSLAADVQSIQSIMDEAEKQGLTEHIKFLGVITDKTTLATAYQAADLHVFPVREITDDPEGFGMVAIEAAAHGLSTVAFKTGGVVDAISHDQSGYLVESNNYHLLSQTIIQILENPLPEEKIKAFANKFEWSIFGNGITASISKTAKTTRQGKH